MSGPRLPNSRSFTWAAWTPRNGTCSTDELYGPSELVQEMSCPYHITIIFRVSVHLVFFYWNDCSFRPEPISLCKFGELLVFYSCTLFGVGMGLSRNMKASGLCVPIRINWHAPNLAGVISA